MGGRDPIRALGIQAKISQVTNTYATPSGAQTELHSPHSISEQGLEMHVFHENHVEIGKQWNWGDYALSPTSSKFCSHWTYAGIYRDATIKWQPCFWVQRSISNSAPSGIVATHFSKMEYTERALHFIFIILNMVQTHFKTFWHPVPEMLKKQTFLL